MRAAIVAIACTLWIAAGVEFACGDVVVLKPTNKNESATTTKEFSLPVSKNMEKTRWIKKPSQDLVFVFVHGVFSSAAAAWTHDDGSFWPSEVAMDERFKRPGVFVAEYGTALSDPNFGIDQAAHQLYNQLSVRAKSDENAPLENGSIIFVAHSMGGLVVRQMIVNHPDLFSKKKIGLFLLASPSRGSEWADRIKPLSSLLSNKMVKELEKDSAFVTQLDRKFSELLARRRILAISGMDVFESKFIIPGLLWNSTRIVDPDQSRYYFGEPRQVPQSDHFSIAKPSFKNKGMDLYSHEYLLEFFVQRFEIELDELLSCRLPVIKFGMSRFRSEEIEMLNNINPAKYNRKSNGVDLPGSNSLESVFLKTGYVDELLDQQLRDEEIYLCLKSELAAARSQREELRSFGTRCEGGGFAAKSARRQDEYFYSVPEGGYHIDDVRLEIGSINRGDSSMKFFADSKGKKVGFSLKLSCASPAIPFGPGAWINLTARILISKTPTNSDRDAIEKKCLSIN